MSKRVFAVHTAADDLFVSQLRVDLRAAGIDVITSENLVKPGTDFAAQIESVMRRSPVVLVLLSRATADRPWVSAEIATALAQQQVAPKLIVPVIIEREAEVPFFLKNLQYIDMSTSAKFRPGLDELVKAILSWEESGPGPATWQEARMRMFEADEREFKATVARAVWGRNQRSLLLTSALTTLAGALAALFAGFVASGTLAGNAFSHATLYTFGVGVASGAVASALLSRQRRRG